MLLRHHWHEGGGDIGHTSHPALPTFMRCKQQFVQFDAYAFSPVLFLRLFLGHLCLIMGKPQIGHFVAANEDFPEFKPPKVARVGFVGYLTINYLPTHVLPNIILHYTFLYYDATTDKIRFYF